MSGPLLKVIAVLWVGVLVLAGIMMSFIGLELWVMGFFFGMAILMTGLLGAVLWYWNKMVRQGFERMRQEGNYLAHWTYTPEEWDNFTYNEGKRAPNVALKAGLYILIPAAVIFGIVYLVAHNSNDFTRQVMPILIMVLGVGVLAIAGRYIYEVEVYKQRSRQVGEVYITGGAVYQDGVLNLLGSVERIKLEEGSPAVLCISGVQRYNSNSVAYDLRVPVPGGHESEARQLMEHFSPSARLT